VSQAAVESKSKLAKKAKFYFGKIQAGAKWSMATGWYGRKLKENDLFTHLGFASEDSCRDAAGVGESTWYAMIRIAEGMKNLKFKEFIDLKSGTASLLIKLPEEMRYSDEWIEKSKKLTKERFEAAVNKEIAKEKNIPVEDLRVLFKLKVFEGQRTTIVQCLEYFAKEFGLGDDMARALELLAAEHLGAPMVLKAIAQTLPDLREAVDWMKSNHSSEEIIEYMTAAISAHVKALDGLVRLHEGEKKKRAKKDAVAV
jgi:hypothetical protein